MIWLMLYVVFGVAVMLEVRHAIPDARLMNAILAGVLWPLFLYRWLSAAVKDWHNQWKEGGKHW